ncbi:hybrid sensor histidine kinase/response regulator [Sphingomonas faeni]|uniref:hybrid sensor histidine kinase/response regulator n=1 Tax=Sphingomonas faeni TaxID=185950 RepID=UPI0033584128
MTDDPFSELSALPRHLRFLEGGGQASRLILKRDWSDHPLGEPAGWSEALKATLSTVLNSPESMILAWGRDELSFFFNETYFPLLGPRLVWAMGAPFREVWADAWEQAEPIIQEAFAGRSQRFTDLPWKLSTDRGQADTWFTFSYSRILDEEGEIAGLFIFTNETTARVQADAALKRSQAELGALNETLEQRVQARTAERDRVWQLTNDLIATARLDGYLTQVNPAWTRLLGWSEEELLTRPFTTIVDPADHAETADVVARLAAGGLVTDFVDRVLAKDDSKRTIMWTAVPEMGSDLFHIVGRDMTEQYAVEDALRQSQKLEAIGQLTGGVAHDFNNLLTVIRGSVDLLRRDNIAPDKRQRYLDAIGDTADRASKLTGQLLAFARRQTLEPEVIEVEQRLGAISDMLDSITGAQVTIQYEMSQEECRIRADVSQFETALVNLAVNARDAMDGKGTLTIRLRCGSRMPAIRGHGPGAGEFVAVSLTDTGTGIPADVLERIFEPFFTTKEVGKGTGLGLSQVFGFAKQSGGDVDVHSVPGEGATFTLYLPQAHAVWTGEPRPTTEAEPVDGAGRCVLVVEDNISVGQFATQLLEDLGYRTRWVTSAEEALEQLGDDGDGFDIVFSDVVMPGMGGIELAKRLARDLPALPVVLASGYSHVLAEQGVEGLELIRKPYSATQLSTAFQKRMTAAASRG